MLREEGESAGSEERLLDEALAPVPPEYHESMCRNHRVNREILAAREAQGGSPA